MTESHSRSESHSRTALIQEPPFYYYSIVNIVRGGNFKIWIYVNQKCSAVIITNRKLLTKFKLFANMFNNEPATSSASFHVEQENICVFVDLLVDVFTAVDKGHEPKKLLRFLNLLSLSNLEMVKFIDTIESSISTNGSCEYPRYSFDKLTYKLTVLSTMMKGVEDVYTANLCRRSIVRICTNKLSDEKISPDVLGKFNEFIIANRGISDVMLPYLLSEYRRNSIKCKTSNSVC